MAADLLIPAPASWRRVLPTDAPVLRNDLWCAFRSITRGAWCVAVYGDREQLRLIAMSEYVTDDFGALQVLEHDAQVANAAWYATTFAIDQAANDWMAQFEPMAEGTPLHTLAAQARRSAPAQAQPDALLARVLPEPHRAWYAASISVDDDLDWQPGQPLVSVEIEHDETHRMVLTGRQARALGAALLALVLTACGGGGDDPDQAVPTVPCVDRPEVCR